MLKNTLKTWFAVSNAIAYSGVLSIAFLTSLSPVQAQIVPDNTLPVNSQVSPGSCAGCTVINGGTVRGANLFHSFREFSILTGGEAYFNNAAQIQNILTRVTGSSMSNIDGLIRANGIANLYLLNPNGIVFGPNASLNIGGSFVGTTAGSFQFPDGSEYSAINPQAPSLLAVNLVPGVQFGARPSGSTITNAGNLAVTQGQNLTLLGGTTTSTGTLTAPAGTVQVLGDRVALLENALVDVSSPTAGGTVLIGGDYKGQGTVPNAAQTYVSPNAAINANAKTDGNGGKVIVWADGTTRFYGNIRANGGTQAGDGGFVEVSGAKNLSFQGFVDTSAIVGKTGTLLLDPTNITIVPGTGPNPPNAADGIWSFTEDPGDQTIGADVIATLLANSSLTLQATNNIDVKAQVSTTTPNNLTLKADNISIDRNNSENSQSVVYLLAPNGKKGGDITISADSLLSLKNGGQVNTFLQQSTSENTIAGDIIVTAKNMTIEGPTDGKGGITGIFSTVGNGAGAPSRASDLGTGGNIKITISGGSLKITGKNDLGNKNGGDAGIAAKTFGTGNARTINIETGALEVSNGGFIDNSTTNNGNAGAINITAQSIKLTNDNLNRRAIQSVVQSPPTGDTVPTKGNGGDVNITTNSLLMTDAAISTEMQTGTTGLNGASGKAGDITINLTNSAGAGSVSLNKAVLSSNSAGIGNPGSISILPFSTTDKGTTVTLERGSLILSSTEAGGVSKIPGAINISTGTLDVKSRSELQTIVRGKGNAGLIKIVADNAVTFDGGSAFSTIEKGVTGDAGIIGIKTGTLTVKGGAQLQTLVRGEDENLGLPAGRGNAGGITIVADNSVTFDKGFALSNVGKGVIGNAGAILIGTELNFDSSITQGSLRSFTLNNNSKITTSNLGSGNAGGIFINARDQVLIQGKSEVSSQGNSGGIFIGANVNSDESTTGGSLSSFTLNSSEITTTNSGNGNAGGIFINARDQVLIENVSEVSSQGNQGIILIGTELNDSAITQGSLNSFKLLNNSKIITNDSPDPTKPNIAPQIQAGNIFINARDQVLIQDNSEVSSKGNNGIIFIGTELNDSSITQGSLRSFTLNNSKVTTNDSPDSTLNKNPDIEAGGIFINARDQVLIENGSEVSSKGNLGGIFIGTELNVDDGESIRFQESSLSSFKLLNNSKITTNDSPDPTKKPNIDPQIGAGGIFINARDQVLIQDNSEVSSQGNKGQILIGTELNLNRESITTQEDSLSFFTLNIDRKSVIQGSLSSFKLLNNSKITTNESVDSTNINTDKKIEAGSIFINARDRITLDNSFVTATSRNGNGGNITIDPGIVLLRRGSRISTSSGTEGSGGGNGGDIKIDSTFIVSAPRENNDIFANAFGGSGGVVEINATNLYWIDILSRDDLARRLETNDPTQLSPNNLFTNDITAISQTDPTSNGVVSVNELDLDVTQGLGELNLVPTDTSKLIAQGCATGKRFTLNENKFIVTGRSGIPASPEDVFRSSRVLTELGSPTVTNNLANSPATSATTTPRTSPHPIIEAQGWIVAPNGKIRLVAQSTNPTVSNLQQNPITCPANSSLLKP
ncbi:MAG: filamentous hemagglutinin N-terminal domain-containing protein [Nostoc sp. DedQUE08]|uniref:two-partner secretion domain-containing protein n=1 Tax=Nostoc sp. DedQUE08 TaxID=3075393 RepID=UPI002AD58B73|nr:filamentous hemagglutinin N-terminal domain-containing protein [Nostoc sp. DedQUE08]MDZ8066889.1 filamentous hemagglutinin N-terminal domain-containing protein [Nostoc sp. DedQUE08]